MLFERFESVRCSQIYRSQKHTPFLIAISEHVEILPIGRKIGVTCPSSGRRKPHLPLRAVVLLRYLTVILTAKRSSSTLSNSTYVSKRFLPVWLQTGVTHSYVDSRKLLFFYSFMICVYIITWAKSRVLPRQRKEFFHSFDLCRVSRSVTYD